MLVICNWELFFSVKTTQFQSIISTFYTAEAAKFIVFIDIVNDKTKVMEFINKNVAVWTFFSPTSVHLQTIQIKKFANILKSHIFTGMSFKKIIFICRLIQTFGVFIKKVKCMGVVLNKIQKVKKGSHAHWGSQRPVLGICLHHTIACTYTKYEILHNLTSLNRKDQNFCFKI